MVIKGLFYFNLNLNLLKCRLKVFSTLIWNCWNGDKRSSLLQYGIVEMAIKVFLYFNLDCWNVDQRSSLPQFGVVEMSIKGLLFLNLELLKCRLKVLSTLISIWTCWNGDQRSSLLQFGVVEMSIKCLLYLNLNLDLLLVKNQNLGLDFKSWVHCCSIAFGMSNFYLFLLDFELYQEKFNWQKILFLRNIWFLKLGSFEIDI